LPRAPSNIAFSSSVSCMPRLSQVWGAPVRLKPDATYGNGGS
jgi:hypothetical protein